MSEGTIFARCEDLDKKKKGKQMKALCILRFFFPIWRRHRGAIVVVVSVAGSARSLFSIDLSEARRYLRRIDEISSAGRRGVLALGGRAPRRVKTLSMFRDSLIRITADLPVVFGIPRPCRTSERIPLSSFRHVRRAPRARAPFTGTKGVKRI